MPRSKRPKGVSESTVLPECALLSSSGTRCLQPFVDEQRCKIDDRAMRLNIPRASIGSTAAYGFGLPLAVFIVGGFSPFHKAEPIYLWLLAAAGLFSLWCAMVCCAEAYRRVRASRSPLQILLLVPLAFALFWPVMAGLAAVLFGLRGVPPIGYGG